MTTTHQKIASGCSFSRVFILFKVAFGLDTTRVGVRVPLAPALIQSIMALFMARRAVGNTDLKSKLALILII